MNTLSRRGLLAAASLPLFATAAPAQVLNRVARTIIGFPAGGSSDVVARLYAERLRGSYATQVVVEARTGAAGRIAVEAVKAAEADGATLLQTPASMLTVQPHVFPREVRYDALTDLIPVSTVCSFPFAICVPEAHPARDLAGLLAWCRAQQGEVPFASPAAGAIPHFLGIMLARAANIRLTHVPYRGAAPAMQDVIGGRLPIFLGVLGDISPFHTKGARMLAMTGPQRNPRYADIPTMAELGYPALTAEEWFGVLLPAGTPSPMVAALHTAIVTAAAMPDMRAALDRLDYDATTSASPAEFAARIRSERDHWAGVVRDSGFTPEN